ncbi:hypothetical protein BpHYR1_013925 [Brachionus plicatilis]|uniref:Uncharacterized protein n=1 Tax=Brachionus plicatilis TaxID=10195 RepID=A0A3M7R485_BRAPC|nr:hypothetical protein BpHYR1_013925 [Brachionus plicatilis]
MPNKRLEKALNAGKLYQLGLNFIDSKPENLSLLYRVNCVNKNIDYGGSNGLESGRSNFSEDSGSNAASDENDKIEILSLQFNQSQNLIATGDSDGNLQQ